MTEIYLIHIRARISCTLVHSQRNHFDFFSGHMSHRLAGKRNDEAFGVRSRFRVRFLQHSELYKYYIKFSFFNLVQKLREIFVIF
jgi:hypothetical protein